MRKTARAMTAAIGGLMMLGTLVTGCSNELKVESVEPATGTYAGTEQVIIHGNGFQPGRQGVQVKFGRRDATGAVIESSDRIKVTTPSGDKSSSVDVTVVFDDGRAFQLKNAFKYIDNTNRATMNSAFNQLGAKPQ